MLRVLISGLVQGVGFRQFIKSNARKLNIKGWVQNLPDRNVEAMFVGSQESLESIVDKCRKGPFLAEIKDLKIEELPDQDFKSFEIIK